jgi:hypothetical protein
MMAIRDKLVEVSKDKLKLGFQATLVDNAELRTLKDLMRCLDDLEQYAKETHTLPDSEASALELLEFDAVFDRATLGARWRKLGVALPSDEPVIAEEPRAPSPRRAKKRKAKQAAATGKREYITGDERLKVLLKVLQAIDSLGGQDVKGRDIKSKVKGDTVKRYIHRYMGQLVTRKWVKAVGKTSDKRYSITAKGKKELE